MIFCVSHCSLPRLHPVTTSMQSFVRDIKKDWGSWCCLVGKHLDHGNFANLDKTFTLILSMFQDIAKTP